MACFAAKREIKIGQFFRSTGQLDIYLTLVKKSEQFCYDVLCHLVRVLQKTEIQIPIFSFVNMQFKQGRSIILKSGRETGVYYFCKFIAIIFKRKSKCSQFVKSQGLVGLNKTPIIWSTPLNANGFKVNNSKRYASKIVNTIEVKDKKRLQQNETITNVFLPIKC